MSSTTFTISANGFDWDVRSKRDVYDVWAVEIVDDEGYLDDCLYFETAEDRDDYENENGLVWCGTDFESVDGMRHKHGDSAFYDEPVQVDVHADVCTRGR